LEIGLSISPIQLSNSRSKSRLSCRYLYEIVTDKYFLTMERSGMEDGINIYVYKEVLLNKLK